MTDVFLRTDDLCIVIIIRIVKSPPFFVVAFSVPFNHEALPGEKKTYL